MKSAHFGGANGGPVLSAANKVDQVALDEVPKYLLVLCIYIRH